MKPWNWYSKVQARDVYAAPKRITALEALDGKKQLEVYAARVYVAEDEGGYIWLNLSMLSQDKATRVVRVPVGLLVDADGQQNGNRRTDLANHGVVVPAPASTGNRTAPLLWACQPRPAKHPKIAGTVRRVLSGVRRNRCRVAALLSVLSAVTWHHRGRSDHHARYLQETVHMHSLRQRPARIVAALCGLIALLVLGVSSAAVDAPAPQPRIIPLSGSMTLGGTSTVTTALLSPEVASASPTVKAPHK